MLTLFLITLFLVVAVFWGMTVSWSLLRERSLFVLIPTAVILGLNGYNFFVNIISYFIPIKVTVWLVLLFFIISSLVSTYLNKNNFRQLTLSDLNLRQYRVLIILALGISLLSGIVALKSLALDDLFVGHIPLAKTITEGNFPVVDPTAPDLPLSYHYAAELFTANFNLITGLPLWLGYDLQIFVFSGALFLMLFALVFSVTKHYWSSVVGSMLFIYGAGLQWLYLFIDGGPILWKRYVLGDTVEGFWRFLTYIAFPKLNTSFIHTFHNHSTAVGAPIFVLFLFLYFKVLTADSRRQFWSYSLLAGLTFGYLALSLETYFTITLIALLVLSGLVILSLRWEYVKDFLVKFKFSQVIISTIVILSLAVILAFTQGGIFASMTQDNDRDKIILVSGWQDFVTLDFAPDPAKTNDPNTFIYLLSPEFFVQFGLPLILIIPALYYFWRKREGYLLWLAVIGGGAFLVPFLFRYPARNWEMSRFFILAMPIFSLLAGIFLVQFYYQLKINWHKRLVIFLIVLMGLSGVLSQLMFAVSSLDRFGSVKPLVMKPTIPQGLEVETFKWISLNTTLADRFFPYDENFIRHTGRFAPGPFLYFTFNRRTEEIKQYNELINNCSPEAVKFFKLNYFYITPTFPIKDWQECLVELRANLVYSEQVGEDFNYIYKLD